MKKQLQAVNVKLDRLIQVIENLGAQKSTAVKEKDKEELKEIVSAVSKKAAKKKALKK